MSKSHSALKGSYDVAKNNIILCIWCNVMCVCGLRLKNTLFSTYCTLLLRLYALPFWNTSIFHKAHHSDKRDVLWLASYPVRCDWPNTSSVRRKCYALLPYWDAVSRRDDTKTIKPIINRAFVASSVDIITDYNDLYCLIRRVASRRINITMSAFVIGETTNNKHYSTRLKTHVWIVRGKLLK